MTNKNEKTINRFFNIFTDAISLCEQSSINVNPKVRSTLARASILSTVTALEAAANSFIHHVELPSTLLDKVDRLSTIKKFDLILEIYAERKLPRGTIQVQGIEELINLRNSLVHPKVTKEVVNYSTSYSNGFKHHTQSDIKSPTYSHTGIPKNSDKIEHNHALKSLKIFVEFMNFFILELWGISKDTSAIYLFDTWDGNSVGQKPYMCDLYCLNKMIEFTKVSEIKFIDLDYFQEQVQYLEESNQL